jgi:hypothetical protein
MAVLELDPPDHRRNAVNRSEGGRPIGNGQASVIAGDQRAGDNQQEGDAGGKRQETMMCPVKTRETQNVTPERAPTRRWIALKDSE